MQNKHLKFLYTFLILTLFSCDKNKGDDQYNEFYADGEVETLFENNPNGIKVIFINDGYVKQALRKFNSTYRNNALEHITFPSDNPIFAAYREYFNAYVIYVESHFAAPKSSISDYTALNVQVDPFLVYLHYPVNRH